MLVFSFLEPKLCWDSSEKSNEIMLSFPPLEPAAELYGSSEEIRAWIRDRRYRQNKILKKPTTDTVSQNR